MMMHPFAIRLGNAAVGWLGRLLILSFGGIASLSGAESPVPTEKSAQAAHAMLTRLCDDFGPRPVGSIANKAAMDRLAEELRSIGLQPEYIRFKMPGWERREDRVDLLAPIPRRLRVAAMAYTQPCKPFEAAVVSLGSGGPDGFKIGAKGAIGLVEGGSRESMRDMVQRATANGLLGILLINREGGGQLLARTGSFVGTPLPLPVFSITKEEGEWLSRLLSRGQSVRVRVETRSCCRQIESANLVVRLPGKSAEQFIVGAHFDSVDLGQGAIDNGLGIAQLFALAHAWRKRPLSRTVELVWFNGEELGLWGSRHYVSLLGDTRIVAMVNMDMTGVPIGINAMGEDSLVPVLERWHSRRRHPLEKGVVNNAWFGGDHIPFQEAGYRVFTFHGPIDPAAVRYYHDFADTVDKVPVGLVTDSVNIISEALFALINDIEFTPQRRTPAEAKALFEKLGFEKRKQAIGWTPGK